MHCHSTLTGVVVTYVSQSTRRLRIGLLYASLYNHFHKNTRNQRHIPALFDNPLACGSMTYKCVFCACKISYSALYSIIVFRIQTDSKQQFAHIHPEQQNSYVFNCMYSQKLWHLASMQVLRACVPPSYNSYMFSCMCSSRIALYTTARATSVTDFSHPCRRAEFVFRHHTCQKLEDNTKAYPLACISRAQTRQQ